MSLTQNAPIDTRPGYRRRVHVEPSSGAILAMLEDDLHCLGVIIRHNGRSVLAMETASERLPWDTCPGAAEKLVETFAGLALEQVTARVDKKANCTHFHDLAVLAAAHAGDTARFTYDIVATDPVDAVRELEIRRNGMLIHRWIESGGVLSAPDAVAGTHLMAMRDWIAALDGTEQEAARLLQWGSLIAHGRTMPFSEQSRAADLPPNCYTLQPERAATADRVGVRIDFSDGSRVPLAGFGERMLAQLDC